MAENDVKIILVSGGVISGIGKGIVSSSLGVLLKAHGYRVTSIKIDPYLNLDAGTFAPAEHGEVFVLDDGGEVDLDLGNYERFLNVRLTRDHNITTGKVYTKVINAERAGQYLGKTVQIVPHLTDAIRNWIIDVAQIPVDNTGEKPHVCIVELGGTVGDLESDPYLHAISQMTTEEWAHKFFHVHVSMVIELESHGQAKTKPLQHSIQTVQTKGLRPDLIVCRSERPINDHVKEKISSSCNVSKSKVIGIHTLSNIYKVPLLMMQQNVLETVEKKLLLTRAEPVQALRNCPNILQWTQLSELVEKYTEIVQIALVGKYFSLDQSSEKAEERIFTDAYASVLKALKHAATHSERDLKVIFVVADHLEDDAPPEKREAAWKKLKEAQGILVPGGFGSRGVEGKMLACKYARENDIPFLGVCLGMQCAAVEFARNVCGIKNANSTEFAKEKGIELEEEEQVVVDMPEHHGGNMGGTMRLGRRATVFLTRKSKLYKLYGEHDAIEERHRHRYEINPKLVPRLHAAGLEFVGMGVDENNPITEDYENSASRKFLKLACRRNQTETDFLKKVTELCECGASNNTSIRMEMLELKKNKYFVGVQYHPEYTSHPLTPSPPFLGLLLAASGQLDGFLDGKRMPSPVNLFKDVDPVSGSKFQFLPSAGNSSASLLAYLNEENKTKNSKVLEVPGRRLVPQPSPPIDENSAPVFTSSADDKRVSTVNGENNEKTIFC